MTITLPALVAPNELIQSAWGNSVRSALDELDDEKLDLVGGTLSGDLVVSGTVTANTTTQVYHLARKDYVDTAIATAVNDYVAVAGDIMTGSLQVVSDASTNTGVYLSNSGAMRAYTNGSATAATVDCRRAGSTSAASGQAFILFGRSASDTGAPSTIGSVTIVAGLNGVAYNTTSDYRLKNDKGPVDGALKRLRGLRPIRATWKNAEYAGEFDTLLAHEVQQVVPYAVTGEKDAVLPDDDENPGDVDPQMVDRSALIPLLVAAIQELEGRLEMIGGA